MDLHSRKAPKLALRDCPRLSAPGKVRVSHRESSFQHDTRKPTASAEAGPALSASALQPGAACLTLAEFPTAEPRPVTPFMSSGPHAPGRRMRRPSRCHPLESEKGDRTGTDRF